MFVPRGFRERLRSPLRGEIVIAIALLGPGCTNDARDAHCTPDTPDRDTDPACIYAGAGSIPPIPMPSCDERSNGGAGGGVPTVCPTFSDVVNVLADPAKGNCSSNGCHGLETPSGFDIFLPIADEAQFYASLTEAIGSVGRPYVVPDDPSTDENEALQSWIGCSLRGDPGGGFPMPPPGGMVEQADVDLVSDWLRCGAPAPVPGEGGGGAGGGDVGGGDAGGAGGGTGGAGGAG